MRFVRRFRRRCEQLERRDLLAAVAFLPHEEVTERLHTSLLVDLDGDRDLDVLAASPSQVTWLENLDGQGEFGQPQWLWTEESQYVQAGDLDGDGDQDVLLGSNSQLRWLENIGGHLIEGPRVVEAAGSLRIKSIAAADVNQDGALDVLFAADGQVWLAVNENREFQPVSIGTLPGEVPGALRLADLDSDGDLDVVASAEEDAIINWYRNTDGQTSFEEAETIALPRLEKDGQFDLGDMDGDGDVDIVALAEEEGESVVWYENDGAGRFNTTHDVSLRDGELSDLWVADADQDGDLDVFTTSSNDEGAIRGVVLHINRNGLGQFDDGQSIVLADYHVGRAEVGDVNGDGLVDLLLETMDDLLVLEAEEALFTYRERAVIVPADQPGDTLLPVDMNGDGALDWLVGSASRGTLVWYESSSLGTLTRSHTVARNFFHLTDAVAGDVDADGDMDVIATSAFRGGAGGALVWFENDGDGRSYSAREIDQVMLEDSKLELVDLDGDDDLDLLLTRQFADDAHVMWLENLREADEFVRTPIPLARLGAGRVALVAEDFDLDGDTDVLVAFDDAATGQSTLVWHENFDGRGTFIRAGELPTTGAGVHSLALADLDLDGDDDLLVGAAREGQIVWYENMTGLANLSVPRLLAEDGVANDRVLARAADLDGDGDEDVIALRTAEGVVSWYEQTAPAQFSSARMMAGDDDRRRDFAIGDIDQDGDPDLVIVSRSLAGLTWHENRVIGDTNDDGRFDSSDLVVVFQTGKYEDGLDGGTTFDEGDWNGDGEFDSSDLVLAFQAGTYSLDALPDLRAVAAAVDRLFAKLG